MSREVFASNVMIHHKLRVAVSRRVGPRLTTTITRIVVHGIVGSSVRLSREHQRRLPALVESDKVRCRESMRSPVFGSYVKYHIITGTGLFEAGGSDDISGSRAHAVHIQS